MRSSQMLAALRDAMLNHALVGASIPAATITDICRLLNHIAGECEQMEKRLTGDLPVNANFEGSNVISLATRALIPRDQQPGGTP